MWISQRLGVFAVRGISASFSQPISQLRNGRTALRNGTRVPNGGFVAAKHPSKWCLGYEMEDFKAWRFCNHFTATKRVYLAAKWHSCDKGSLCTCKNFRRGR
uniref:Uncharacterized protein n=1 Tax=Vitis vinifera TaxID=29760 RepID=A5B3F6_VITVI|nr:hypothetical protein VITISV_007056 [Vitis vinifera]